MKRTAPFEPDWLSPPGATVSNLLEERRFSLREFANATHHTVHDVARLLSGLERLTPDWAHQLAQTLGATPEFWLRREEQYRLEAQRLSQQANADAATSWLNQLPFKDMVRYGWVERAATKSQLVESALTFFGVASLDAWRRNYTEALQTAAYRTTNAYGTRPGAVAAWLRQGEILAREIDCEPWNPDAFRAMLLEIRYLSREPDPAVFLPALKDLSARCGIAVVVLRTPDGCRASGATKFLTPQKALMLLSFRYLSDDQFWFTVFHEAGHLLLHTGDGLFLEGVEPTNPQAEAEADSFAITTLFTQAGFEQLQTLPLNHFAIARFAKRIGVAQGIVVGQLQQMKRVPFHHFNYLKVRYTWQD